jgi:hypothetical protein
MGRKKTAARSRKTAAGSRKTGARKGGARKRR